jgi:UDP-3-O-[3-hydroxymyristoyl] glucosamine N-acyltransferase
MNKTAQSITSHELAKHLAGQLVGNPDLVLRGVATLESAKEGDISFFNVGIGAAAASQKYRALVERTRGSLIIASEKISEREDLCWILCDQPSLAFQKAIELFCPSPQTRPYQGIHPTAVVDSTAILGENVTLGPYVVIGPRASIGTGTYIGPHCIIGSDVTLGSDCLLHPGVVIRESCVLGQRVILQPSVVLGSCGFGYDTKAGKHTKLEQLGNVIVEDDVEIGAGSCIDRARFQTTRIGRGTKIDNLVMIAHGVTIGADNLIVAQAGIAGSSKTGRWVVLGGQVGVAGHLELSDGVMVAAQSGVSKSLSAGTYGGTPAQPIKDWHKDQAYTHMIPKLKEEIKSLQERLTALENQGSSSSKAL